jgi:hypothetical protein
VNLGLFGFKESLSAPFAGESIALEIAATFTLAGWVALDFIKEPRRSEHAVRSGPERQPYSLIG